ncbi:MAG: hypothetical protein ABSG19_00955 [Candidatus Aminicenantales bacterium]
MKTTREDGRIRKTAGRVAAAAVLAAVLALAACGAGPAARIRPPSMTGQPYLRFYGQAGGFAVWVVNGAFVRENLDEEFTNFGQHLNFRFIPAQEFWLDEENAPGEERFFIDHLLVENRVMARGAAYDKALDQADAAEKSERDKNPRAVEAGGLVKTGRTDDLLRMVHKELLKEFSADVKVWVVDGELVRDVFFIDFTEGGHDKVYKFVPAGEVWLDDDVNPGERRFILLHELHERALMARGWPYGRAHKDSSRVEFQCRCNPGLLDAALRAEVKNNTSSGSPERR